MLYLTKWQQSSISETENQHPHNFTKPAAIDFDKLATDFYFLPKTGEKVHYNINDLDV